MRWTRTCRWTVTGVTTESSGAGGGVVIPDLFLTMEHDEALYNMATEVALQQGDLVQFISRLRRPPSMQRY